MPGALGQFWKEEVESIYKLGEIHTFIVYLNVDDFAREEINGYISIKKYIMEQMNAMGIEVIADAQGGGAHGKIHIRDEKYITNDQPEDFRLNNSGTNGRKKFNEIIKGTKTLDWGDKAHEGGNMPAALNKYMYDNRDFDLKLGLLINPLEGHGYLHGNMIEWATNIDLRARGYLVVAMAKSIRGIPGNMLSSNDMKVVRVPYPDYTDRLEFINHLINREEIKTDIPPEHLARITGGLELKTIHTFVKMSEGYKKRDEGQESQTFLDLVEDRKQRLVNSRSGGMLEILETANLFFDSLGGLENVKSHLRGVVQAIAKSDLAQIPSGILLLGPQGTDKLSMAKALANEANMTCIQLKKLKDFCADGNASEVLALLPMFMPAVVVIDDIDIPEGIQWGHAADSKTPIPPELLDFMSVLSLRGKVLWVGISSRPDKIDPVFSRSGRFPDKLLFLMPDKNDREDILKKAFENNNIPNNNLNFPAVADDKYTQNSMSVELDAIVKRSYQIAQLNGRENVSQDDLLKSADNFIPSTTPEMSEYFTLLAIREVNSRDFIPPNLPSQISNVAFEGQRISRAKIDNRLEELAKKLKIK